MKFLKKPEKHLEIVPILMDDSPFFMRLIRKMRGIPPPSGLIQKFPGRMTYTDAVIDFENNPFSIGDKISELVLEGYHMYGVIPLGSLIGEPGIACCIDRFEMEEENGHNT